MKLLKEGAKVARAPESHNAALIIGLSPKIVFKFMGQIRPLLWVR